MFFDLFKNIHFLFHFAHSSMFTRNAIRTTTSRG